MIKRLISALLGVTAFTGLLSAPAAALSARTWVSGTGVDQAGCGPIANPCRTLQYAHDNTSAGGEIDVKDSAGYGVLVITKAMSVIANGITAGVLAPAAYNAITVSAGYGDKVLLQGLTVEGTGIGYNGISYNSGAELTVSNCVIRGFVDVTGIESGNGITVVSQSDAKLAVVDTTISGNTQNGVHFYMYPNSGATSSLVATRLIVDGNKNGIYLDLASALPSLTATIADTTLSHNTGGGIIVSGNNASAIVDGSRIARNNIGLSTLNATKAFLRNSAVFGNSAFGVSVGTGTILYSYRNNAINGNGTDVSGTVTTAPQL